MAPYLPPGVAMFCADRRCWQLRRGSGMHVAASNSSNGPKQNRPTRTELPIGIAS